MPGSPWAEQGAASSWEIGSQDVQSSRELGYPFVPHNPLPALPLPPPFQPPGFKVKFGGGGGLGCHLSVPFTDSSSPWGFWLAWNIYPHLGLSQKSLFCALAGSVSFSARALSAACPPCLGEQLPSLLGGSRAQSQV